MKTQKKEKYNYTSEFKTIIKKVNEFKKYQKHANLPAEETRETFKATIRMAYIIAMKECCLDLLNACEDWLTAGGHIEVPGEDENQ